MPIEILKPKECLNCDLYVLGKGFIQPEGSGSIPLLLVGESAGYNEYLQSLPFRPDAMAGSMLERVINRTKYRRNEFALTNLIQCHPPGDELAKTSYEYEAVNHCRVHFDRIVKKYNPKVILALGSVPLKHLTGFGEGKGKEEKVSLLRGYVLPCSRYPDIKVIASYHPSFVRRGNSRYIGLAILDLMKAIHLAQGRLQEGKDFILDPTDGKWLFNHTIDYFYNESGLQNLAEAFLRKVKLDPDLLITYDIETEKSAGKEEDELEEYGQRITQIQFSIANGSGVAFPFEEPFITIAKAILESPNPKAGHNVWKFDNPILKRAGFELNGRLDDTMWMFHHFQADLPLGLQSVANYYGFPFPWKHYAGSDLAFYGCADVDSVQRIMTRLPEDLKKRDLWKGYDRYVYQLEPILVQMSDRGIPINQKKQEEFGKEIDKRKVEIDRELVDIVPESLLKFKEYKRVPKQVTQAMMLYESYLSDGVRQAPTLDEYIKEKTGLVRRQKFTQIACGDNSLDQTIDVWVKVEPFNCNSWQQIQKYIKHQGHSTLAKKAMNKVKKEITDDDSFATSKEVLKRLSRDTGDPAYPLILEYKELTKMKGAFIDGWKPSTDSRIHSEFLYRPATMQLSSRNPNCQQGPKHTKLATKFRETIEAPPGYLFLEIDMKSFHAKTLAFLAEDKDYLRLASHDIHSFVTAHVVNFPGCDAAITFGDENLRNYLKEVKSKHKALRDDQVKHVVHGIGFGLSERGCYERYRDDFNPTPEMVNSKKRIPVSGEKLQKAIQAQGQANVKKLYKLLKGLFPRVFKWQQEIMALAHNQGYLDSPYGTRRWFWNVQEPKFNKFGDTIGTKSGEQAEQAIAFLPANLAFCHMREGMLILEERGINERAKLINNLHDALLFEIKESEVMELAKQIKEVLERRSTILINKVAPDGFWCEADIQVGRSMATLEEVKL